jgi:hypothetical protein
MTSSVQVRQQLVDALRLDLVGPGPGHEHESEVIEDALGRWYLTGYLVPFEAREKVADPTENEDMDVVVKGGGDDNVGAPEKTSARRGHFPSSMGLSVLVSPKTKALTVTAQWGDYTRTDRRPGEKVEPGDGSAKHGPRWERRQQHVTASIAIPTSGIQARQPVDGSEGLEFVIHARDVGERATVDGQIAPGTRTVSVFLVNNREPRPNMIREEAYAYQAGLVVDCDDGFVARPNLRGLKTSDNDEAIADLQYRATFDWAVGHNVATTAVVDGAACRQVRTEWLPTAEVEKVVPADVSGVTVSMDALAAAATAADVKALLGGMLDAYGKWIEQQGQTAVSGSQRQEALEALMVDAERAKERIAAGFVVLNDDKALEAFRLANRAMATQARQRNPGVYADKAPSWRLFQIAFVLMNLRGIVEPTCPERQTVDLIFFPTGGGKTEAYLGLAAFTLVYRRLVHNDDGAGVSVLMRYTLRLLTLDQLSRASTLICALELERQKDPKRLGQWPFEIGLWVGQAATPNRMGKKGDKDDYSARAKVIRYQNNPDKNPVPVPIDKCPWCGTAFSERSFQLMPNSDTPTSLRIGCMSRRCAFKGNNALPILAVDDEIYRRVPCFVISTIDKFAALPWVGETGALFGRVDRKDKDGFYGPCDPGVGTPLKAGFLPPPDLIIQDELHLISGPLGTVAGLYETAIEALSTRENIKPKLVASTATVRRARSQIQALFARSDVQIFPPPGPNRRDSFFAKTVPSTDKNARLYLGVAAQGHSGKVMMHRVYLALLAAAQRAWDDNGGHKNPKNPADPYMTLVGYFNALRELGGARRVVEDEVTTRLRGYGTRKRQGEAKPLLASRTLKGSIVELTSRVSTAEVATVKDRLDCVFNDDRRIDVALATNMISVGLDITRLGLIVVMGQPKTTAEYIQATSRVGRDDERPGLVVTLLNMHKPRDRSHYERFESYHETFYRSVEATSVTPFSPRAIDRALAGVVVGLVRQRFSKLTAPRGAGEIWSLGDVDEALVRTAFGARAANHARLEPPVSEELRKNVEGRAQKLISFWKTIAEQQASLGGLQYQREVDGPAKLLHLPLDPERHKLCPKGWQQFKANRSLRDVEPTVNLWLKRLDESEIDDDEDGAAQ